MITKAYALKMPGDTPRMPGRPPMPSPGPVEEPPLTPDRPPLDEPNPDEPNQI